MNIHLTCQLDDDTHSFVVPDELDLFHRWADEQREFCADRGEFMPTLYGFRYDEHRIGPDCIRSEFLRLGPTGGCLDSDTAQIHEYAAQLRGALGPEMFGIGLAFIVFEEQLDDRQIPAPVLAAVEQLPGAGDLLVAVTIDARSRHWWAVVPRQLPELEPVQIHIPATSPNWEVPDAALTSWLWTAALGLEVSNRERLQQVVAEADYRRASQQARGGR